MQNFRVFSRRLPNLLFGEIFSGFSAKQIPRFKTDLQMFVIQKIQPKLRSFAYRYLSWSSIYCMSLTWIWNTSIIASLSFFDFIINYYLDD